MTAFSVITDYHKGVKYPLADFNITPDVAIVDPDLAETMPKKLTAHTGMDAMTHAIEAYVSTLHCDYTDPLALHAIKMISEDLVASYNGDMDARDRMHNAQCLAGMAFSNALLGIVHSMAHKTGAAYTGGHIVHAAPTPCTCPRSSSTTPRSRKPPSVRPDRQVPGPGRDHRHGAHRRPDRPHQGPERQAGHPRLHQGLRGGIIDEKEFLEKLPTVAELAVGDACTGSNPRSIDPKTMEKLLTCCFYDTEVDF